MARKFYKLLGGVLGSAFIATSAIAADLPAAPMAVAPAPPPPPMAAPAFDWGGVFVGIEGGYYFCSVCLNWTQVGLQLGYNISRGNMLYGINGELGIGIGGPFYGELSGRLGHAVGAAGRILAFADAGVGIFFGGPYYFQGDVGAEFALGRSVSLSTSFGTQKVSIGPWVWTANVGLNWRPGH
jgi:hypothetical protein